MKTKTYTLELKEGDLGIILSALLNQQMMYEKASKDETLKAIVHGMGQLIGAEITIQSLIHRHGELIELFREQT